MQIDQLRSPQGATIEGPLLISPQAFSDKRGWFFESWNQRKFDEAVGEAVVFSQDNHSRSAQGVLRGLHYQIAPEPQAKLVRTSVGEILMWRWTSARVSHLWAVGRYPPERREQATVVGAGGLCPWLSHPEQRG